MIGKVKLFRSGGYDPSRVPNELDTIADVGTAAEAAGASQAAGSSVASTLNGVSNVVKSVGTAVYQNT